MAKKPKLAGLVVTASEPTATTGIPQRGEDAPKPKRTQNRRRPKQELVAYGFKVPRPFLEKFQDYAIATGRKNNQLLFDALDALIEKEAFKG